MKKISKSELLKHIEKETDINYIAHVATPMTAIWAKACLYYMHEELHIKCLKGIFLVNAWTNEKWAINQELPIKTRNTPWLQEPVWFVVDNSDEGTSIKWSDRLRSGRRNSVFRVVYMIDTDSLWTMHSIYFRKYSNIDLKHIYLDFDHIPFNIKERITNDRLMVKGNGLAAISKMYARRCMANISAMVFKVKVDRIYGYDKKDFFSEEYIRFVRKVLEDEKDEYDFCPLDDYVIYLSDPYDPKDVPLVTSIAEETLGAFYDKGYKIYVKQHPRETGEIPFKRVKTEYLPKEYAIEALVASCENKPKAIVAGSTSAIIEIARLWDIDCYFILNNSRLKGSPSLEWFRNYTNCAIKKIPNLMNAKDICR